MEVLVEMLDRARVLVDGVKIIYKSLIVENCMLIVTCSGTAVVVDSSFEVTKEKTDPPTWLKGLPIAGMIFLFGFALFFIWALAIGKAG